MSSNNAVLFLVLGFFALLAIMAIIAMIVAIVMLAVEYWYVTLTIIGLIILYLKKDKIFSKRAKKYHYQYRQEYVPNENSQQGQSWDERWKDPWESNTSDSKKKIPLEYKTSKKKRENFKDIFGEDEKESSSHEGNQKFWFEENFKQTGEKFNHSDTYSIRDCLELLNLDEDCTLKEIKEKYRELVLRYHPDKSENSSQEKIKAINNAYEMLLDNLEVI